MKKTTKTKAIAASLALMSVLGFSSCGPESDSSITQTVYGPPVDNTVLDSNESKPQDESQDTSQITESADSNSTITPSDDEFTQCIYGPPNM